MSALFTREQISAYLARKLIPCRPEFQIRKLYDKKYEYTYNIHLLGGYTFIIIDFMKNSRTLPQGAFDGKFIYVDPDTLGYKVYEKNGEKEKGGQLPKLSKFEDLRSKKDDFWTLFAILEIIIAAGKASKTLDYPLTVYDRACYDGSNYSTLFGLPVGNPGNSAILTSEDESRITEYCRNRYKISFVEKLSNKNDNEILEWIIYLDQDKPEYKIRGRDGNVHGYALDEWTYLEAKEIEPKVSTGLLMSISEKCEIYFGYFSTRYINYVATNNADEFKKLTYITNRYAEELGLSLVRVLAESDTMTYYRQTVKCKQLFEGELDALVAEGSILRLAENLYRLPKRFEPNYKRKEGDIYVISFQFFDDFVSELSLYWAKLNNLEAGDLRVYRYAKSITSTIYEALYRSELKLHYKETGAVIDYHDLIFAKDYLLYWHEIVYILNKNSIGTPEIKNFFSKLEGVRDDTLDSDGKHKITFIDNSGWKMHSLNIALEILITGAKKLGANYSLPKKTAQQPEDGSLSADICIVLKSREIFGRGNKEVGIDSVSRFLGWPMITSAIMSSSESDEIKTMLCDLIAKRQKEKAHNQSC